MMFINAVICVLTSSSALKFTETTSVKLAGIIGSCLMALGFLCLAFSTSFFVFIMTALATSIGELLTILSNGLLVSRMAPKQLVASYNGFFNLSSIGLFLGPTLGGYGLQFIGGKNTFLLLTVFPLLCIGGYWILGKKIIANEETIQAMEAARRSELMTAGKVNNLLASLKDKDD